jgi:phosphoglycerate dehydrogenase-like enzyme
MQAYRELAFQQNEKVTALRTESMIVHVARAGDVRQDALLQPLNSRRPR